MSATMSGATRKAAPAKKAVALESTKKAAPPKAASKAAAVKTTPPKTKATPRKKEATETLSCAAENSSGAVLFVVSDEERYRMIAEAAYYRAEIHHFKSDPVRDWIEAEKDIAALLGECCRD